MGVLPCLVDLRFAGNVFLQSPRRRHQILMSCRRRFSLKILHQTLFTNCWVACLQNLTTQLSSNHNADLQYHMGQASKACHANPWILRNRHFSVAYRLPFLVVGSVVCYGSSHRTIHKQDVRTISVFSGFSRVIPNEPQTNR